MVEDRGGYRFLAGKLEGRRPLGRPRYRWAGHVARMGQERGCIRSWRGNWREGNHWGDVGIGGMGMWHVWVRRVGLKFLVEKLEGRSPLRRPRYRWVGHVARMGEERGCKSSWWGNRREGDHW